MTFDLTTKNWQLPSAYVKTNNSPCGLWEIPNKINWAVDSGEVVLLISQAGVVGSSTFVNTAKNKIITPTNAKWSNNQLLFGKPTIYINSGGLIINGPDDFNVNAGQPFCFEFYAKLVNTTVRLFGRIGTISSNNGDVFGVIVTGTTSWEHQGILVGLNLAATYTNWNHFAISRDANGLIRGFVNGVMTSSHTNNGAVASAAPLCIGSTYTDGGYQVVVGNFAEIRFVKGNPVYTSNFTVMNTAFIS